MVSAASSVRNTVRAERGHHGPGALLRGSTPVHALLERFGPSGSEAVSPAQARAYARSIARARPENFTVLSLLVPADLRDDFASVYAFCRWADDLSDETGDPARALALLAWWRAELGTCYGQGPVRHPVMVALAPTIARHGLPRGLFEDLIGAFEQDQRVRVYETWEELLGYCRSSANPVGRLVLMLGGWRPERDAEVFARSDELCSALQVTNHLQDAGQDLRARGRVYLPTQLTGLGEADLRALMARGDADARARFARAVAPVHEATSRLYDRGASLPGALDARIGPVVWLLTQGGVATHRLLKDTGLATLWDKPRLGRATALALVARAWLKRATWKGGAHAGGSR
jgi:squalene synthase HpnC